MNLYLDDIRPCPEGWTLARTVEEAKDIMMLLEVENASLDHDMGECEECAKSFPHRGYPLVTSTCRHLQTGYDFVLWMAENEIWPKNKPTVHSMNPVGRQAMQQAIERYWK